MNLLRILIAVIIIPPSRMLMRLRCRSGDYQSYKLGKCSFYGPEVFLSLCATSMEQLSRMDRTLYEAVLTQKLMVWYEPEGIKTYYRLVGVPDSFTVWKEQGLIACIVYAHYSIQMLTMKCALRGICATRAAMAEKIAAPVVHWLTVHGFPSELIASYQ